MNFQWNCRLTTSSKNLGIHDSINGIHCTLMLPNEQQQKISKCHFFLGSDTTDSSVKCIFLRHKKKPWQFLVVTPLTEEVHWTYEKTSRIHRLAHECLSTMLFKLCGFWIPWSSSLKNSFLYHYTCWKVLKIFSHIQRNENAWVFSFLFPCQMTKTQNKLLLPKHFNINYTTLNKFTLLREESKLQVLDVKWLDFMQINYGEYQVLSQTTGTRST